MTISFNWLKDYLKFDLSAEKVADILTSTGLEVEHVETVDPLNHALAVETVKRLADLPGVKAVIFKSPCVVLAKPQGRVTIDPETCIGCKKCIREIGCPALTLKDGKAAADPAQCTGCGLCAQLCPVKAIRGGENHA